MTHLIQNLVFLEYRDMNVSGEGDENPSDINDRVVSATAPQVLDISSETNDIQDSIAFQALDKVLRSLKKKL